MNELLIEIQPALMTILVAVVTFVARQIGMYYRTKVSLNQHERIITIINASVQFVEQVSGKAIDSEEKFQIAFYRAKDALNNIGLNVTDEELELLIEAAVYGLQGGE